uniref:Uncharacterized protein n=1 Tax=Panagrolaimus davidi TaxID=227884 RepID=A0A914PKH7_9BILA
MKPATTFYLHRILYSSKEYPLTYSVYLQNLRSQLPEKSISIKRLKYLLIIFIGIFLLFSILLPTHIYVTNAIFGPYHLTLSELIKHVKDYKKNGERWKSYRMEYIQVEFGEGNILNPEIINNKTQNIRRYSDAWKKDRIIATYKKLKNPKMYIKLPTKNSNHFHSEFPFDFTKFSYETLKCILRILLQTKSQEDLNNLEFNDKIDIFNFIKNEYSKNATEFNVGILTKCGILIGFLYKPMYEIAFLPTGRYLFSPNDISLDATRQYFSTYILYVLIICCTLFLGVFLYTFFNVIQYYIKRFRFEIFERYGFFSATKYVFNKNVEDELWLLNLPGNIYEQLIQLDDLINRSTHKYSKIAIINLPNNHQYVVISSVDHVDVNNFEERPFTICPVSDIRKIVSEGIYCINDSNVEVQIRWPSKSLLKEDCRAEWLHSKLLEISEKYRQQFVY